MVHVSRRKKVRRLVEKRFYQEEKNNQNFSTVLSDLELIFSITYGWIFVSETHLYWTAKRIQVLVMNEKGNQFLMKRSSAKGPPGCCMDIEL